MVRCLLVGRLLCGDETTYLLVTMLRKVLHGIGGKGGPLRKVDGSSRQIEDDDELDVEKDLMAETEVQSLECQKDFFFLSRKEDTISRGRPNDINRLVELNIYFGFRVICI